MLHLRRLPSLACLLLGVVIGCVPAVPPLPASLAISPANAAPAGLRYEALVNPVTHAVTISPVGFRSQATGLFVRSANALWNAPNFTFDLLVTNNTGASLSTVRGVVLSTTPGSPTVTASGTNGTLGDGKPYYDYGTIANLATGTVNWGFAIPSATPFRFGFTIQQGAGVDAGPVKNQSPTVVTVTPASPSISTGGSTSVTAATSDPNSDTLTYSWSAPSGGTITGSGATVTYTAPGADGVYPVNCTVDDGKGATATAGGSVTVAAGGGNGTAQGNVSFGNVPTTAVKRVTVFPAAVTIDPGDPLTVTATGLDNPGNPVATFWNWSQVGTTAGTPWRGTFDQGTTGAVASWRTFDGRTDPGPVTLTARSLNNQTASMVVTVRNKAPAVISNTPAAAFGTTVGTPVNYNVVFHDANGDNSVAPVVTITPNAGRSGYGLGWSGPDYNGDMTINLTGLSFSVSGPRTVSITNGDGTNTTTMTWNVTVP